jgi:hypothetical protein
MPLHAEVNAAKNSVCHLDQDSLLGQDHLQFTLERVYEALSGDRPNEQRILNPLFKVFPTLVKAHHRADALEQILRFSACNIG